MNMILLVAPIMLVVLSGYLSGKFELLSEESNITFTRFAFFIAMPCQLFTDFSNTPISQTFNVKYISAFALSILLTGFAVFLYTRLILKSPLSESALNIMGSSQVNTAYFAIPLFILVFDNPTPVLPILIFQVLILTTIVLLMIEHDVRRRYTYNQSFLLFNIAKIFIKNPVIMGSILGVIFSYFNLPTPTVVSKFLNLLGVTAAPLALFALGQSLHFDLNKIRKKDLAELAILTTTKLIILPLIAFLIGKYAFHLDRFWLASLVIMAAMPAPKNMFIFAIRYNLNVYKASTVVALTTLISFITLNILLVIFQSYI